MKAVNDFFNMFFGELSKADFALLAIIDFSAFVAVCIAAVLLVALSPKFRSLKKRPFLHMLNAFSAITLVIFLSEYSLTQAAAATCIFWFFGYGVYGVITLIGKRKFKNKGDALSLSNPVSKPQRAEYAPATFPSQSALGEVRLEHAASIADKLLLKNLGRGDRQEIEKIKTSLSVLKVKETLTPQETETLNEMFNALLKLMARYDL